VLGFFLLSVSQVRSQAPSPEPEGQLQLFFYSTEGPSHFIVVEKKYQKLKLFEQKNDLKMLKEFTCATGENPGTKKSSGDARTPEGIYHITEIYEDKRITVFGSRAFHLDYPNAFDAQSGHLGDGIFIHGTNKKLNANSTNGCITLNNSDLDELAPYLAIHTIPIIVLDSESELSLGSNLLLEKDSSQFQDVLDKLAFNPVKTPIEDIKTLTYFKQREQIMVSINYKIFEDKLTQYTERKRAYLRQTPSGNWRTLYAVQTQDTAPTILALRPIKNEQAVKTSEDAVKAHGIVAKAKTPSQRPNLDLVKVNNLVVMAEEPGIKASHHAKSKPSKPSFDKDEELRAFIEKWRTAWVTKDIDAYINCYSPSFKSGNLHKEEWRAKKTFLNQKYKFIAVQLHNIVIEWTSTGAKVSFQQSYQSDQLQTSGIKTLHLINKKNRWMIENEII
jgi:murein L,D-transpeptidase YafK